MFNNMICDEIVLEVIAGAFRFPFCAIFLSLSRFRYRHTLNLLLPLLEFHKSFQVRIQRGGHKLVQWLTLEETKQAEQKLREKSFEVMTWVKA